MIEKDTTTIVRFYVTNASDGFPATGKASSITAKISIDGDTATAITDRIDESDSTNLPGWYEFEHTFSTAGNAFITFTCANCRIMPWEEQVVEISTSPAPSASDIATAVWGANVRSLSTLSVTSGGISFDIATSNGVNQAIRVIKDYGDTKWLTASGFATPSDLTGLSTFDPVNDTVTINATQAAGMATATGFATPSDIPTSTIDAIKTKVDSLNNTDLTGIATTANVTAAQTAIINAMPDVSGLSTFDPANDTVTINATQAATMVTADVSGLATPSDIPTDDISAIKTKVNSLHNTDLTGIATSANVTAAQTAVIEHGDDNWVGGGSGGATAQQIWEYPNRTITDSPTDISSLATKTDLSNSQSAVISAMPSVSGLATGTDVTNAKSDIIAAIPAIPQDYAKTTDIPDISGLATSTNVSSAQAAIIAAIPAIPTDYAKTTDIPDISGLSTFNPAQDTVQLDATQLASLATGSEVTDAKDDIITAISDIDIDTSDLAKATDVAVVADMLKQVDAGVLHWSTTATVLTLYKEDNTVLRQYSLQRDIQGNITRIDPING